MSDVKKGQARLTQRPRAAGLFLFIALCAAGENDNRGREDEGINVCNKRV
jgi:hypothetical protein